VQQTTKATITDWHHPDYGIVTLGRAVWWMVSTFGMNRQVHSSTLKTKAEGAFETSLLSPKVHYVTSHNPLKLANTVRT
jgi:hypothetical protein